MKNPTSFLRGRANALAIHFIEFAIFLAVFRVGDLSTTFAVTETPSDRLNQLPSLTPAGLVGAKYTVVTPSAPALAAGVG